MFQTNRGNNVINAAAIIVAGETALFARPEFRLDAVSYDVITPSAARGIFDAIHWRPAIRWIIDEIHLLAPIAFIERVDENGRRQVLLRNVSYRISAHFELTDRAGPQDEPERHRGMFRRALRMPRAIYLGSEEFPGEACLCSEPDETPPVALTNDLGWMLFEANHSNRGRLQFFRARLDHGVLRVPRPDGVQLFG